MEINWLANYGPKKLVKIVEEILNHRLVYSKNT